MRVEELVRRSPLPNPGKVDTLPALVSAAGRQWTHAELRSAVDDLVNQLPDATQGRCLVHVPLQPEPDDVAAYLAVLEAGHVALVTDGHSAAATPTRRILERYPPDLRVAPHGAGYQSLAPQPQHLLHPDLALLLSTSGSTGSPKLVRLSHDNILSNAAAIADALGLTAADRGITSLPLHYCYGLSVLHAHLYAGGGVVLSGVSVLEQRLWETVDRHRVTTLAAVPHTLQLIESTGILHQPHPSLRLITQAGGRLAPESVERTALLGRQQGWELAVMYGQTEATARIAVLNPALTLDHPDAVGHPVRGTQVRVDTTVSGADAATGLGELVVQGPGVMMGYALHPDDLACGQMLRELRTGDLARVDEHGIIHITGRRSSFVKVMGVRVDLGAVEHRLEAEGLIACVTGDDTGLRVAVEPFPTAPDDGFMAPPASTRSPAGPDDDARPLADQARVLVGEASGLGVAAVQAAVLRLPRLPGGKIDRQRCDSLVRATAAVQHGTDCETGEVTSATITARVARSLRTVLGRDDIDLARSFVQLGGDSLSHVRASVQLEKLLGPLPSDWHHQPLRRLVAEAGPPPTDEELTRRDGRRTVEMSVLLRAVAVIAICGSHADLFRILGGAHTLLAVAGFNAARFGLATPSSGLRWRATGRMLIGIAVPTMAIALFGMVTHDRYGWANVVLANWMTGDLAYGFHNELWFIDALVASLLVMTAVLSVPPVARWWHRDPWAVAFGVAVLALIPRFTVLATWEGVLRGILPTVFWFFAIGAALAYSRTKGRQRLTLAVAAVGGITFFPDDPIRNLTILAGIAALALVPSVRVPAWTVPVVSLLASASLYIYLIQFQIISLVPTSLGATLAALAAGCVVWRFAHPHVQRLQALLPAAEHPTSRNGAAEHTTYRDH